MCTSLCPVLSWLTRSLFLCLQCRWTRQAWDISYILLSIETSYLIQLEVYFADLLLYFCLIKFVMSFSTVCCSYHPLSTSTKKVSLPALTMASWIVRADLCVCGSFLTVKTMLKQVQLFKLWLVKEKLPSVSQSVSQTKACWSKSIVYVWVNQKVLCGCLEIKQLISVDPNILEMFSLFMWSKEAFLFVQCLKNKQWYIQISYWNDTDTLKNCLHSKLLVLCANVLRVLKVKVLIQFILPRPIRLTKQ